VGNKTSTTVTHNLFKKSGPTAPSPPQKKTYTRASSQLFEKQETLKTLPKANNYVMVSNQLKHRGN